MLAVTNIGGRLGRADGDKLKMLLPASAPALLKDEIRTHKVALLKLLQLDFLIVQSDTLNATIFWAPDEATRDALVSAGAHHGIIYTSLELSQLVDHRVTVADLPAIHAAKCGFNGRLKRRE